MLKTFLSREIPFRGGYVSPSRERKTDLSDWDDIYEAAVLVFEHCVRDSNQPGWAKEGQHHGIGVFFWPMGSDLQKKYSPYNDKPAVQPLIGVSSATG